MDLEDGGCGTGSHVLRGSGNVGYVDSAYVTLDGESKWDAGCGGGAWLGASS